MLVNSVGNDASPPQGGNAFSAWFGRTLLKLSAWKIEGQLPKLSKFVVTVAPHTSNWDFFLGVAVLFALRIKIKFLGKHSIFVPGVKQLLEFIGGIPVDRRAQHGVVGQIVDAFNKEQKMILAIAPEGTRSPIYPWKTGFLSIAHKAQVPIVMIAFDFSRKVVKIGPTLETTGNTESDMQRVYDFYATVSAKYPQNVKFHH
jgi:1-acyl-sn-glycerol-3-phosphate acyltransferase